MEASSDLALASVGSRRPVTQAWLTPARFGLLLGLMVVLAFSEVIFGGRSFFYRDFGLWAYPNAFHHRDRFWTGEVPLWNPLSSCGIPFLAQWNTITLYPFSLIYLLLPLGLLLLFKLCVKSALLLFDPINFLLVLDLFFFNTFIVVINDNCK